MDGILKAAPELSFHHRALVFVQVPPGASIVNDELCRKLHQRLPALLLVFQKLR
jgi:hypothetical protein